MPELLMDGANAYIYDGFAAPAEQVDLATGGITYLMTDTIGSVRGAVTSNGALTGTASYDAWGNPQIGRGLTATTPFGYAGGYTDPTGLLYLINRYYDPQVAQFLSVDPLVDDSLQPYTYAGGDPVLDTDPAGLYYYRYSETLGGRGKAAHEFAFLAQHVHRVFPFGTGACGHFYLGEHCDFHPGAAQNDNLHVSRLVSTSVTLKVDKWCQVGVFGKCIAGDPPGSTIKFTIRLYPSYIFGLHTRTGFEDVLSQVANSKGSSLLTNLIAPEFAKWTWEQQAVNLSRETGGAESDVYLITGKGFSS